MDILLTILIYFVFQDALNRELALPEMIQDNALKNAKMTPTLICPRESAYPNAIITPMAMTYLTLVWKNALEFLLSMLKLPL